MNYARARRLWLIIVSSACHLRQSTGQTVCRDPTIAPHQAAIWQNDFPFDLGNLPVGLCDGTITVQDDGGMCVTGKVNFDQLRDASGTDRPTYQITSGEVSFNGHMASGSAYVWLGPDVFYGYDFITSYTVDGVTYSADSSMTDRLLAASRGSIDGFCLSPAYRQVPRKYKISHKVGLVTKKPFNIKKIKESSYTFISRYFVVYEYHEWMDDGGILGISSLIGGATYKATNFLTETFTAITAPDITAEDLGPAGLFPTNLFAPLARLTVFGTVSTDQFPVPVSAPDDITESIQLDVEYAALLKALRNGLFSAKSIPLYFYVRFKKVEPFTNGNSCFTETSVILEMTAPQQEGEKLDDWVDAVVLPALLDAGATIGMHFGKRIPPNTETLQKAYEKYASCGVELNVSPTNCYHPACTRSLTPDDFNYPPQYYSFDLGRHATSSSSKDSRDVSFDEGT